MDNTTSSGRIDLGSGHTGTALTAGTASGTSVGNTAVGNTAVGNTAIGTRTGTSVFPVSSERPDLPNVGTVRGLRLDQILLLTSVLLLASIVALLAATSWLGTQNDFDETARRYTQQLSEQAREIGQTLSHTLSLTGASSLRDNNYAFLGEVVASIVKDNHNVLRVQIFDAEKVVVADSDPATKLGSQSERKGGRRSIPGTYKGQPMLEFQEPIDYGSHVGQGMVVVSYSLAPLQRELDQLKQQEDTTLRRNTLQTAGLGLGFIVIAAVIAAVQSRRVTRPLNALTSKVMELAQGDLQARVGPSGSGGREVQTLGVVFNHMADRISWLLADVRNKAVLEQQVELARKVQETLLPTKDPLQVGALRIAGTCVTADACGGDWWLRAALDNRRVVVGIGDVTGHGLSTALVATSATSGFAAAVMMREASQIDAPMLITALNQILFHLGRGEYQMSSALAVMDVERGEIDYAAGAHPSACVYNRRDGKLASLPARGALLGAAPTSQYASRKAQLRPGDVIVWYTDGLTECRDAQQKLYGFQRLCQVVQQHGHLPAEQLRDAIVNDAREYSKGAAQQDDITVVIAEYTPTTA